MINEDVINDLDLRKRTEEEWCNIYHVKIVEGDYYNSSPIDELEFCFYLMNHCKYYAIPNVRKGKGPEHFDDYSISDEMEMRAMKINRDIFANADRYEKKMLKSGKFVTTKYIAKCRTL